MRKVPTMENYNTDMTHVLREIKDLPKCTAHIEISTDKEKVRFIKEVERLVRKSIEYKDYVAFLKEYINMENCSFFTNIKAERTNKIKLEIHHEPFTLYDITNIVVTKAIANKEELNYFKIAEEVMKLHYQDKVGLIPLSLTVHKLVHLGTIFIPLQAIYGRYIDFIKEYRPYITNDYMEMLEEKLKASVEIKHNKKQDLSILGTRYVYLEVDGMTFPKMIEETN